MVLVLSTGQDVDMVVSPGSYVINFCLALIRTRIRSVSVHLPVGLFEALFKKKNGNCIEPVKAAFIYIFGGGRGGGVVRNTSVGTLAF